MARKNMQEEKIENFIKKYHLRHFISIALTLISIYFWVNFLDWNLWEIVGAIINIIGLAVWWLAKLTLSKNWGMGFGKPQIKQLVTHGIYSKIRHPMYCGINLTLIGLILLYPKIWFIIISLLVIIYFLYRMRAENKYLSEKLGDEYRNYVKKTWF
ncbi:MAG: isoprenylcysteine carboxylmethyltransferase family protein [Candidatus Paceibacterota bacterium]|jgi:protein-S-isoprenylcysteine O-methyltransferase Ste14